jgi:glycosyltransferase involved in cell wall biosynthesis
MHIVHLETGRHLYGGARQVLALLKGLRTKGITETLVCPPAGEVALEAARAGFNVREVPTKGDLDIAFIGRLTDVLRELKPDLLHVHSRRGAEFAGGAAARRLGLPALLTRRVDHPETRMVAALKFRNYRRIVAISAAVRDALLASGVRPERIQVIHSAVDAAKVEPAWSRERTALEFGGAATAPLVACVAQFIPRKGHLALLQAWRSVAAAMPGARLVLFGQGPEEAAVRRAVRAAALSTAVDFAGYRRDLPAFLGRFDLVVHAATREGLGLALLEAQSAGVPVVAFRAGGVPEIVVDGETGVLLPPGDTAGLADAMLRLLRSGAERQRLGQAAWERVARDFRVADMADAYLTCYRDLLDTPRS